MNNILYFDDGGTMPQLGLGTWKSKPGEVYDAVREAIRVGYRHIDCAHLYGNEAEIGQALKDAMNEEGIKREALWITSKLWNNAHHPKNVKPALRVTLENLRLDYLDLYLMHWPVAQQEDSIFPENAMDLISLEKLPLTETWSAMEECVDNGLTRYIGVSNFSAHKLSLILEEGRMKPVMNQIELHPYLQQSALLNFCKENHIHVTAYSPLGSVDRPAIMKAKNEPLLLEDPVIKTIAKQHHASPAQILIAWALHLGVAVVPKSVNPQRIRQNFESSKLVLSESEMEEITGLDLHRRYLDGNIWAIPGSGYTLENLWDE